MRGTRPRLAAAELAIPLLGAAGTLFASYLVVEFGGPISVGLLLGIAAFAATVFAFATRPHLAIAVTIPLFALLPTLKVLVLPELGPVKDLVVVAAAIAATAVFLFERPRMDRWIPILVGLLLAVYVLNVGGTHDIAWAQGVRLVGEPLALLLVGLILPRPERTFRWAAASLVLTGCAVAAYGVVQQLVGGWTLVGWGYSWDTEVRTVDGLLRSFGTLDEPFAYAAFLSLAFAAVAFWLRRGAFAWGAGALILLGLGLSFVRTAILILVALAGLALRRRGHTAAAVLFVAGAVAAGALILVNATGSESRGYVVSNQAEDQAVGFGNVVLNGRISAWQAALGDDPADWVVGKGVGEVGTAATRATFDLVPSEEAGAAVPETAVDSGYLAAIADVGILGFAILVVLLVRLAALAWGLAVRGTTPGWLALAILVTLLLDALTRASFTGFPTAFLGLLLVGVCLAAGDERESRRAPVPRRS